MPITRRAAAAAAASSTATVDSTVNVNVTTPLRSSSRKTSKSSGRVKTPLQVCLNDGAPNSAYTTSNVDSRDEPPRSRSHSLSEIDPRQSPGRLINTEITRNQEDVYAEDEDDEVFTWPNEKKITASTADGDLDGLYARSSSITPPGRVFKRRHEAVSYGSMQVSSNNNGALASASVPASVSSSYDSVNPTELNLALERLHRSFGSREITPTTSPSRKRQRLYGDRFIPNRSSRDMIASFSLLPDDDGCPSTPQRQLHGDLASQKNEEANRIYTRLLRNEMFDDIMPSVDMSPSGVDTGRALTSPIRPNTSVHFPATGHSPSTPLKNLFTYSNGHLTPSRTPQSLGNRHINLNVQSDVYSLSPIKCNSRNMLLSPRKSPRTISKLPYKVLDAPDLADDFYLNLVDWGSTNILSVGLGQCVYLWNSSSGRVTRLCELNDDIVTSVNWIQRGSHLAIGTFRGYVQIWDAASQRRLRTMTGHTGRVGSLSWNSHILSSGSRDRTILHRDVRSPDQWLRRLTGHNQEVCGLKWNSDDGQLASGGNDNKLIVWDKLNASPLYRFSEHQAAVKAIAWSPHQRGLLASGGGTADRTIKFWDTLLSGQVATNAAAIAAATTPIGSTGFGINLGNDGLGGDGGFGMTGRISERDQSGIRGGSGRHGRMGSGNGIMNGSSGSNINGMGRRAVPANLLASYDTGSQVCNLAWSRTTNEVVSTHGYSQNQVVVWRYPSMTQIASLTGHTYRVLYLAMSPCGSVIVTGAGDETLRFWHAFKKKRGGGSSGGVGGSSGSGGGGSGGSRRSGLVSSPVSAVDTGGESSRDRSTISAVNMSSVQCNGVTGGEDTITGCDESGSNQACGSSAGGGDGGDKESTDALLVDGRMNESFSSYGGLSSGAVERWGTLR